MSKYGLIYAVKTCTTCKIEKPIAQFYKNKRRLDGLKSQCKTCCSVAIKARYAADIDKMHAYHAAYYAANIDRRRAANAKWRAVNLDQVRAYSANWRAANKKKAAASFAAWRAANLEKCRAAIAAYRSAHPEAQRIARQNRRARKLSAGGKLSVDIAERLLKLQKGKCACGCNKPLGKNFHRDHIIPLALGGSNTDQNIQLMRPTCNLQKSAKHPIDFMQQRGFLL